MKILNVTLTTRLGGLEQAFLDYNEALKITYNDVISIIHKSSPIEKLIKGQFYQINIFSKYDPFALFKLKQILAEQTPDLIITHGNRAHYTMSKIHGSIPVIGVCHTYSFEQIKHCDYIISVNKDMRNCLLNLGYNPNKIFYIPNMIRLPESLSYNRTALQQPLIIGLIGLKKLKEWIFL